MQLPSKQRWFAGAASYWTNDGTQLCLMLVCCCIVAAIQKEQLQVTDVVVLIDREQGGAAHLAKNGLTLHAAFKLSSMLDVLQKHKLVDDQLAGKVRTFIAENQTQLPTPAAAPAAPKRSVVGWVTGWEQQKYRMKRLLLSANLMNATKLSALPLEQTACEANKGAALTKCTRLPGFACRLTYEERAGLAKNSVAKRCFEIMARKKTNLAVAADVATADEMLALAEQTGPHICVFKTHVDIFDR